MGTNTGTLPPFEIAIAGGNIALARPRRVAVAAGAERAAGRMPSNTGIAKNLIEAACLRGALDAGRARDGDCDDTVRNAPAAQHRGRAFQVRQARVGA
jgi:hypothetical protein